MRWFIATCLIAALLPLVSRPESTGKQACAFPGWPQEFQAPPWRELSLEAHEARYWGGFAGRIARFSDGKHTALLRWVARPTRRLHSAAECYQASGYTLKTLPSQQDASGDLWSAFQASRGPVRIHVRERIEDQAGSGWSDTSSWFWSALLGRSSGPWLAMTFAEQVEDGNVVNQPKSARP